MRACTRLGHWWSPKVRWQVEPGLSLCCQGAPAAFSEASVSHLLALASRDPPRPQELEAEAAVAAGAPQGLASAWGKLASSLGMGQSYSGR